MKTRRHRLLLFLFIALYLTACEDRYSGWLVFDGMHHLAANETLQGELIQFDGVTTVAPQARITGSVYMLGGELRLDGAIDGDISLLDGVVIFGPTAAVAGRVNRAGGQLSGAEQAHISGGLRESVALEIPIELTRTQRSAHDSLLQSLIGGFFLGIVAVVVVHFLPHTVHRISHAATRHVLVSASLGLLVAVVGPALAVMMAFTVVLVPLAFLTLFIGALAVAYGWIALGVTLGNWLAARFPNRSAPAIRAFLGTWLFMLLLGLVGLIPIAGPYLGLASALIALGAVLLTRFGAHTFVPAAYDQPSPPFAPLT